MISTSSSGSVVLVGCGRLGSAVLEGWLAVRVVDPREIVLLTRSSTPAAEAAQAKGVWLNPPVADIGSIRALVLAVKPAQWRDALEPLVDHLSPATVVVSVMAGVSAADLAALSGRPVARVMPTTAVAQASGVAALWSDHAGAREAARALFAPMADVVDLDAEGLIDPATAVAGSAPAFIYAFVEALARAGEAQGLPARAAARLARGALRSAGAGVETGKALDALIARIASPGGATRAGLDAMNENGGLDRLAETAVKAAVDRAKGLSA